MRVSLWMNILKRLGTPLFWCHRRLRVISRRILFCIESFFHAKLKYIVPRISGNLSTLIEAFWWILSCLQKKHCGLISQLVDSFSRWYSPWHDEKSLASATHTHAADSSTMSTQFCSQEMCCFNLLTGAMPWEVPPPANRESQFF